MYIPFIFSYVFDFLIDKISLIFYEIHLSLTYIHIYHFRLAHI